MKLKSLHIFIFLVYSALFSNSQNPLIDSLKKELKKAKHDTTRCSLLSLLVESEYNEKIWPVYNEQMYELARKNIEDPTQEKLKKNFLLFMANAINNTGYLTQEHGDINKALEYYFSALKLEEQIDSKGLTATTISNIAYIYMHQGDMNKSLEYVNKAMKLQKEVNDSNGIAQSLNNLGNIYRNKKEIDKSLAYFNESLELEKKLKDVNGVAVCLSNIGEIYIAKGDLEKGIDCILRSLKIKESVNDNDGIAYNLNCLANVMFNLGRSDEALKYALQSFKKAKESNYVENIRNASAILYKIYKKQNKNEEALKMYEYYILLHDSINNEATRKSSIKNQLKYEYQKKADADSIRTVEEKKIVEIRLKQEKTQRYALYGGIGLVGLFAFFMFNRFRVTKKQKQLIELQKKLVEDQKQLVDEKQKELLDSIHYAKRIQTSLLPNSSYLSKHIPKD